MLLLRGFLWWLSSAEMSGFRYQALERGVGSNLLFSNLRSDILAAVCQKSQLSALFPCQSHMLMWRPIVKWLAWQPTTDMWWLFPKFNAANSIFGIYLRFICVIPEKSFCRKNNQIYFPMEKDSFAKNTPNPKNIISLSQGMFACTSIGFANEQRSWMWRILTYIF